MVGPASVNPTLREQVTNGTGEGMLVAPMRLENGPTILVGHSYAGFVVTEAVNAPNVTGVAYVSSYGPDQGESHDDLVKRFPAPAGLPAIRLDENGFLWIARGRFHEAFAHDVDLPQADIMAVVQKVNGQPEELAGFGGRRQPSMGSTSRVSREAQARICERLGAKPLGRLGPAVRFHRPTHLFNLDFDGDLGMTERSLGRIGQNGNHRGW